MITKEHLDSLRAEFVQIQSQFATVIQELEADLARMRDIDRIPQEIITKRDEQIETLIRYHNKADDLMSAFRLCTMNYHGELIWLRSTLWEALKSNQTAFELFMRQTKTIISLEPNPATRQRDTT
ncbi:MAG TPA: hypothetical protein VK589_29955 [Chryseolinea sp.]|nr:hypothetical protein [Chryseolinea sp.]